MKIREVMSPNPLCVNPDTSIGKIEEIFSRVPFWSIYITESKKLVGIVTRNDLKFRSIGKSKDTPVSMIMSKNVYTLDIESDVKDAILKLDRFRINGIAITENERLCGIVTRLDIRTRYYQRGASAISENSIIETGGGTNKMKPGHKSKSYTKQQGMTQQEYLDFCGVKTTDGLEIIKSKLLWQTKGKDGNRPPYWVKLVDCDNNHLKNILIHVKYVHPITKEAILSILESRWIEEHQGILDKIKRWEQQGYSMDTIDKIIHHTKINESHSDSNKREPIVINFTDKSIKIDNENGVMNRSPIGKNTTDE